ncbi:hypothetical protein I552_7200 [Mycobacterium xenopi 3993]|nr:hypothetical protein I552_7200 [Mycobacterium xenopi 3993]
MQRNGELHHAEVRPEMPTCYCERGDQELPNLRGELHQLRFIKGLQVVRSADRGQQLHRLPSSSNRCGRVALVGLGVILATASVAPTSYSEP